MKSRSVTLSADPELAKWCAALTAEVVADEVPEGWYTAAQLASKLSRAKSTMGKMLLEAVGTGKCERKTFRIACNCIVRPVPHYRLTK